MSSRVSLRARLGVLLAVLFAAAAANAEFVRVTAANSVGNSVYDVTSFGTSCGANCGSINPLNTDGALHGSFSSVALMTNSVTGTVDVLVADLTKGQIIRYTPAYNSSTNQQIAACETVVWPASGSNGQGPTKADGLALDANNNLYIVTNKKPALWVLPATAGYACGTNGGYAANPLLIDNSSFFALGDVTLQDTEVATDTTAAWGPGDLLLLIGSKNKANSAELTVYRQATIQRILSGGAAATAPDAVLIPATGFPSGEFPLGFDFWPSTSAGGHTTIMIDTTAGRVLQYDFTAHGVAPGFPVPYVSGLGSALQKLKVGLYLEVPFAFVTSTTPGSGQILQLGVPVNAPPGTPPGVVGVANVGTNAPDGLAVARAAAVSAASCANPNLQAGQPAPNTCDIGDKGVAPHTIYEYNQTVNGEIVERTCVVLEDPRVKNGVCDGTSLDISTLCPGFGHEIVPGTLCGASGLSGSGFAVVQTSAPGVDNLSGIIVYSNLNADAILPGGNGHQNLLCPGAIAAWAPRGEAGEGTVLKVVNGITQEVDEFVDMTGWCDYPGQGSRGASDYLVGAGLNSAQTGTMQTYANQKFLDLQALVNATPASANDASTLNNDLAQISSYLQQSDWACAAAEIVNFDSDVNGFQGDASGTPGWSFPHNRNPWAEMRGRAGQLYLVVNTYLGQNPPNNNWPANNVPTCQTPSVNVLANGTQSSYSVPQNTPVTISWTSSHATGCKSWGGSAGDNWPAAGTGVPLSGPGTNVTPPAGTTTYGVECKGITGDSGMTSGDSVMVTVVPPPTLSSPVASPATVVVGGTAYLSWSVSMGASCVVSGGPVKTSTNMTATVGPLNTTTTFTVTCSIPVGGQTALPVTVTVVPQVQISSFTATPNRVDGDGDSDDNSTLAWTTSNATSCALSGGGLNVSGLATSGSYGVTRINGTTTYTLTCTSTSGGLAVKNATVTATGEKYD
jgi:hypothetical protein